jgi:hypothetical protein
MSWAMATAGSSFLQEIKAEASRKKINNLCIFYKNLLRFKSNTSAEENLQTRVKTGKYTMIIPMGANRKPFAGNIYPFLAFF